MHNLAIIILIIYGIWFLLSAIGQLEETLLGKKIQSYDLLSLIPRWSFFAPNPGVSDYHILYRNKLENAEVSPWIEYSLDNKKSLISAVWNPEKRNSKALSDLVHSLIRLSLDMSPAGYKTTFPYLAILNHIVSLPRENHASSTQFMIMQSHGFFTTLKPRVIFRSEFHKI